MRLICRLSRETKPYQSEIQLTEDGIITNTCHEAQKHLDTIIAGEIIISIFYNLIDCNVYIFPGLILFFGYFSRSLYIVYIKAISSFEL